MALICSIIIVAFLFFGFVIEFYYSLINKPIIQKYSLARAFIIVPINTALMFGAGAFAFDSIIKSICGVIAIMIILCMFTMNIAKRGQETKEISSPLSIVLSYIITICFYWGLGIFANF